MKEGFEAYGKKIEAITGMLEKKEGVRAFFICPVRGHDRAETEELVEWIESLGIEVHWPHRDTDQDDPVGLQICEQNREAIAASDIVLMVWNGKSSGCLFDLGMAFALKKPVIPLEMPPITDEKSFQKMAEAYYEEMIVNYYF